MKTFKMPLLLSATAAAIMMTSAPAYANGGLTFVITGDTFDQPYTISNTSTAGEKVVGFGISLVSPYGFDTVNGGFGVDAASPFVPNASQGTATGFSGPATVADGASSLAFTFSNFDVGESFSWLIDVDRPGVATVYGSNLIGSTGYADFSNGLRGLGTFQAFGTQGSQFVITTFTPTPSGVPEPATWLSLILGFGAMGGALRSRNGRLRLATA